MSLLLWMACKASAALTALAVFLLLCAVEAEAGGYLRGELDEMGDPIWIFDCVADSSRTCIETCDGGLVWSLGTLMHVPGGAFDMHREGR